MSLINRVLQDLEDRRASASERRALPNEVRPLPQERRRVRRSPARLLLPALAFVLLAGGGWWLSRSPSPAPVSIAVAPAEPSALPAPQPEMVPPASETVREAHQRPPRAGDPALQLSMRLSKSRLRGEAADAPVEPAAAPAPVATPKLVAAPVVDTSPAQISHKLRSSGINEKAEAAYKKALSLLNAGRVDEAQAQLRQLVADAPEHQAGRQLLIKLLLEQKAPSEARQVLADGIKQHPANLAWTMMLARLQMEASDLAAAAQTLHASHAHGERNADYRGLYAAILLRQGKSAEAQREYQGALQIAPQEARWWLGLAMASEAQGQDKDARQAYLQARQLGGVGDDMRAFIDQKLR